MRHCDEYIDDLTAPECLRAFLDFARSPAHGAYRPEPRPQLFAKMDGKPVRVTVASRFGDVGVTEDLTREFGYSQRVAVDRLTDFSAAPPAAMKDGGE